MQQQTKLGMNKTGIDMSPIDSRSLATYVNERTADPAQNDNAFGIMRGTFAAEASTLGTVPIPGNLRGMATTAMQKLSGQKPELLIDKLGERLAFERTGTRLYEAFISKFQGNAEEIDPEIMNELPKFHDAEARHFKLIYSTLEELGADPTAQTPCADAIAVASSGILQLISDPRSSLSQCLNALLTIELTDNAGWELLISLAQASGQQKIADSFKEPLREEQRHLSSVREWLENGILVEAKS